MISWLFSVKDVKKGNPSIFTSELQHVKIVSKKSNLSEQKTWAVWLTTGEP